MRTFIAALVALASSAVVATAQTFPTRPITLVVPFAAGGPTDVVARIVGERMSQILGQQIVIENIGGAGGMSGANKVAKATPDGYTIVMGTVGTHAQNQTLYAKPQYSAADDFAPVALIAEVPLALITRKDLPVNDLQEFIAYTKANQKSMNFASSGAGAAVHLGCVTLNLAIGVDVTHVAYRGSAPAMNDIVAGRIDYMCEVISTGISQSKGGSVKMLAVLHQQRSPAMPEMRTADEQGLKGFAAYTWNAIFAPKGTPGDIVQALNKAAIQAYSDSAIKARLEELGYTLSTPDRATPAFLADFVRSEIKKWEAPIKASGVKVE